MSNICNYFDEKYHTYSSVIVGGKGETYSLVIFLEKKNKSNEYNFFTKSNFIV